MNSPVFPSIKTKQKRIVKYNRKIISKYTKFKCSHRLSGIHHVKFIIKIVLRYLTLIIFYKLDFIQDATFNEKQIKRYNKITIKSIKIK